MLKSFTERPDLVWFLFNWLLCNNSMEEDPSKSRDNREEAIFVALGRVSKKMVGDEMKSKRIPDIFWRQKSWDMLTNSIWVARRRKEFRIALFSSIVTYMVFFSVCDSHPPSLAVYLKKMGIEQFVQDRKWVQLELIWEPCETVKICHTGNWILVPRIQEVWVGDTVLELSA